MLIGATFLYRQVRVVIEFLRFIPSVALIPVAVLLFGTGFGARSSLASFAATWPLLFQSMYGVQDVDPVARDTAQAYRLGRVRQALFVTLPSAAPYIATGCVCPGGRPHPRGDRERHRLCGVGNAIAARGGRRCGGRLCAHRRCRLLCWRYALQDRGAPRAPLAPGQSR